MDGTKRVGVQHFAMNLIPGARLTTLNESSKEVPIATGSYRKRGSGPVQTNFTYIDVGMTFDATVTELGKGVRLQSKVTQASAAAPDESSTEGKVPARQSQPVRPRHFARRRIVPHFRQTHGAWLHGPSRQHAPS